MRKTLVAIICLAAVAAALVFLLVDWDRRAIMKNLRQLESLVSKDTSETTFAALTRAREIASLFTRRPEIRFPPYLPSVSDRQELSGLIYQGRGMADTISVRIHDTTLEVDSGRREAVLQMTARGTAARGNLEDTDVRELELGWKREDGKWLISRMRAISAIQHPGSGM
ncbi:MAG: nuclear transport factor 2 family protein [Kiritimatiellae bacterium]|nr:nuclear transport factor 2 family protein [Kiritimatiellia bacterium]